MISVDGVYGSWNEPQTVDENWKNQHKFHEPNHKP